MPVCLTSAVTRNAQTSMRVRETSVQKFRAELVHADAVNHVIKQLIAISVECTDTPCCR